MESGVVEGGVKEPGCRWGTNIDGRGRAMDPAALAPPLGEPEELAGVEDDEEGRGNNHHHGDQRRTEAERGPGGRQRRRLMVGNWANRDGGGWVCSW